MEPKIYDWKITVRKACAWALGTFIAGAVGSIQDGSIKPKAVFSAGLLALAIALSQGLRNYQKNRPSPAVVPQGPEGPEGPEDAKG